MKRMIKSATNTCNISARPSAVTGSDADRVEYSTDEWEWLATKDVPDSDGFVTDYSLYRNRDTGLYVTVFGDRDLYGPEDGEYDYESENEQEAWDWFDSYEPLWDDDYSDIYSSTTITCRHGDNYFGESAANKYGDLISEKLIGKTVSKRKSDAEEPGGLIYEANKLGIDMWDLLEALEGMCRQQRAMEIDDSTYKVLGGEPRPVRGLFGSEDVRPDDQYTSDNEYASHTSKFDLNFDHPVWWSVQLYKDSYLDLIDDQEYYVLAYSFDEAQQAAETIANAEGYPEQGILVQYAYQSDVVPHKLYKDIDGVDVYI